MTNIESKQIGLTLITVQLDSKKITNAVLDQIPRLDISTLFISNNGDYDHANHIEPVCRFSLQHFLSSQTRIYKTMRYSSDHIARLIKSRKSHDEAFLFTYKGNLYCDTYSQITGTVEHGNTHQKLQNLVWEINEETQRIRAVIDLHTQGLNPIEIILKCHNHFSPFPRIKSQKPKSATLAAWDNDILGFDSTREQEAAHELNVVINEHGSWDEYIRQLKLTEAEDIKTGKRHESDLLAYEIGFPTLIRNIMDTPFAIIGV